MKLRIVFHVTGILLISLALGMIAPGVIDWLHDDPTWQAFAKSIAITFFGGYLLYFANRSEGTNSLSVREVFLMTALSWIIVTTFAAIPFIFARVTTTFTDALFEAVSGLTTTGTSVISGLDYASPGILLWRAVLQWLGGIGIIVMAMTVLPMLRIGGMQLFRSEFSDSSEKVLPRISQILKAIFWTYALITIACTFCLWLAGMTALEAVCHAFSTVSTGGMSTSDSSIAHFHSLSIELIILVFMVIGGAPLMVSITLIEGHVRKVWRDSQIRAYLALLLSFSLIVSLWRWYDGEIPFLLAIREGFFNTISVMTSTGYCSADYTQWGTFAHVVFLIAMMIGGCTGSTAGGIKIFRAQVMLALLRTQIQRLRRPHGVFLPTFNGQQIKEEVFTSVYTFFTIFLITTGALMLGLAFYDLDLMTCLSGAFSALCNSGLGLSILVGPEGNYSLLPEGAKWVLMFGMLAGRLELLTIFVLLSPSFWRD